jgi:hypothetical protein
MEKAELVLDQGSPYRGRLKAIAERLVVELDPERRPLPALVLLVPVVDQILFVHGLLMVRFGPLSGCTRPA